MKEEYRERLIKLAGDKLVRVSRKHSEHFLKTLNEDNMSDDLFIDSISMALFKI